MGRPLRRVPGLGHASPRRRAPTVRGRRRPGRPRRRCRSAQVDADGARPAPSGVPRARPGARRRARARAPRSCWPASPASASRTLLLEVGRADRAAAGSAPSTSPARSPPPRCGCAPTAPAACTTSSTSPPRPTSAPCSATSRRCGPTLLVVDSVQTIGAADVDGVAGRRHPGQRGRRRADPGGQGAQHRHRARRPRHQGRLDRRPAGARAPRRRGAALRGRPQLAAADGARDEEPLRPGRRGRLLRPRPPTASPRSPTRPGCSVEHHDARCPAPASR